MTGAVGRFSAVRGRAPCVIGIPMMNQHQYTAQVLEDLDLDRVDELIIFDHGSDELESIEWLKAIERVPSVRVDRRGVIPTESLYRSWNDTIRRALELFPRGPVDVVILNNDLRLPPGFLRCLTSAMRAAGPDVMAAYPDRSAMLADGVPAEVTVTRTRGLAVDGGMTGWAFALRGEGFRRDVAYIDERLKFYSGDRDLIHSIELAGYCAARVNGLPYEHELGGTRNRRPELKEQQDMDVRLWWGEKGIRYEKEARSARVPRARKVNPRRKPLHRIAVLTVKPFLSPGDWERVRRRFGAKPRLTPEQVRALALSRMDLTQLATKYGTDKWGDHRYTPHYERHLGHLKDRSFSLLEIGIGGYAHKGKGGESLKMWQTYFPRAQIIGLDIEDKTFLDGARIRVYQGNQTDASLLRSIVEHAGNVQVVIDDGSHRPEHVRHTFSVLFPLLADGGVYVIEDTQTSYWPEFGGSEDLSDPATTMALIKDLLDGLNYEEFVDESYEPTYTDLNVHAVHAYHNLVVIEKGTNAEGTNRRRILKARYADKSLSAASTDGQSSSS